MFANRRAAKAAVAIRRRHRLQRDQVDALPWPHPRPASDPRLVWLHLALIWTATLQSLLGPPENTVTGRAFGWAATIVFGVALVAFCGLYLFSAYCKSQYESFGFEMSACVGFAGVLSIYAVMMTLNTPNFALTYNWSFTVGLAIGNAIRGVVLIKRLW